MDTIRKNQGSKRACDTMPSVLKVLEQHSERIAKLEKCPHQCSDKCKVEVEQPVLQLPDFDAMIDEKLLKVLADFEQKKVDPEIQVLEIKTFEDEVKEIEQELEAVKDEPVEPELPNPLIAELASKLSDLANQNITLGDELRTLERLEDEEDIFDMSISDTESVCTDACRELLKDADIVQCGTWDVEKEMCGGCIKLNAKAYAKEKKKIEKERNKQLKLIKQKQKDLIKMEQKQLSIRLKNLKKNRPEDYGIEKDAQSEMKEELRKLADAYQKGEKSNSNFKINMYL